MMDISDEQVEQYLQERFDENFERIQDETGAGLSPDIREMALQQVLYYWRKLKDIAMRVTETEVRLNLPCQRTPDGREYGIEGVVDIVREEDQTIMYDIKTHETDYVRTHCADYSQQLNIYAHIWQILREQDLNETAIITTALPEKLREAIVNGDDATIERKLEFWDPVVEIPFDPEAVEAAIMEFGEIVDQIENGSFAPPKLAMLRSRTEDTKQTFAMRICRNCDARFSCRSYRLFTKSSSGKSEFSFKDYFPDDLADWEYEERLRGRLDSFAEGELAIENPLEIENG